MRQDVAIERIQRRVIDVRRADAFAPVVEHDGVDRATQSTKGALMQLRPDLRAGSPGQEAHALPGVPQRQDEETRPLVFATARIAHHRPVTAVVDVAFFAGCRGDDHAGLDGWRPAQLHDEVRIPAKLNADSEDAERGFRARRTRLGA